MKHSTYHGLRLRHQINWPGGTCICGGMRKLCYKWREAGGLLYKVMPCHACSLEQFKKDPDNADYLERSETWVDIPLDQQRARLQLDYEAEAARRNNRRRQMNELARGYYLTEQPVEEAANSPTEDLPDEE